MSANDKLFHPQCFTCNCCNKPLLPGDVFAMQGNFIFCPSGYAAFKSAEGISGSKKYQYPAQNIA
jgi:hypothetical protein